mgnify:CR=1 FL=1
MEKRNKKYEDQRIALIGLGAMGVFFAQDYMKHLERIFILLQVVNVKKRLEVKELRSMASTIDSRS